MKKIIKYILLVVVLAAIGGYIYWNNNKKRIIRQSIENAIQNKTDSLYYIHYDSSKIDEINGNASFYNVSLQSDSTQKELLKNTDSLPNALFNIKVTEITANGIDVAGLLEQQNVKARKILLNKPIITIINTGKDKPKLYNVNDTLELYQKILGRFKSINADTIEIKNGNVVITNVAGKSLTTLEDINVSLKNFKIDNTRNYDNIISYFIKDVRATIANIQLPPSPDNTRVNIEKLDYDAVAKTLKAGGIQQYKIDDSHPIIDLKNISLTGLSTDAFILSQQFKAANISCDGGLITIYKQEKKAANANRTVQLSSELIDGVQVESLNLGPTKIVVINNAQPNADPFILNDVKFNVSKLLKVTHGSILSDIVDNADWTLQSSGFSYLSVNKLYRLSATGMAINSVSATVDIKKFVLAPQQSEAAFAAARTEQGDRYDFVFNNIHLQNTDLNKFLTENKIEAKYASLSPILKIYNDKTLAFDMSSKVGKYPHQSLQKINLPLYIGQLKINNGEINYKEKGRQSKLPGIVSFKNLNATIDNLTNIPERIKQVPNCKVVADAMFLGLAKLHTEWRLPLNKADSTFTATGQLSSLPATSLNQVSEPLGMTKIKSGTINNLKFNFIATDYASKGQVLFLYNDLSIEALKKNKDDELTEKGLTSFFANMLIKDDNPQNGNIRTGTIDFKRDISKSFFNMLWKSVFDGVKKTATGKK